MLSVLSSEVIDPLEERRPDGASLVLLERDTSGDDRDSVGRATEEGLVVDAADAS